MEVPLDLRVVFIFPLKLQLKYTVRTISDYRVADRTSPEARLVGLYRHIEAELRINNGFDLLPVARCIMATSHNPAMSDCLYVPLVAQELWSQLLKNYHHTCVEVILETRGTVNLSNFFAGFNCRKTLHYLDVPYYFPKKFNHAHLIKLSEHIFHNDYHIKHELRRGVWLHLLRVFHPSLETVESRQDYMQRLRRVYDMLKAKWFSEHFVWTQELLHLRECIRRDAIRTDPTETFLTGYTPGPGSETDDNLQKLIKIVMLYTLEHKNIKYTQGMTDLLSPILYVMEREDDAYIAFSAMMNRIRDNFSEWCDGTLNKLERLRHLCEVLDPKLYHHLSGNQDDDPFILFFGMVLIECRREFNFKDTLHLLEVLWAAALGTTTPTLDQVSKAQWAEYMTSESVEEVRQAFGEEAVPYSAEHMLPSNEGSVSSLSSRPPSAALQIPRSTEARHREERESLSLTPPQESHSPDSTRDRSVSLPSTGHEAPPTIVPSVKSEGHLPEEDDSLADLESSTVIRELSSRLAVANEMSDLSSLSSATTVESNGIVRIEGGAQHQSPLVGRRRAAKIKEAPPVGSKVTAATAVVSDIDNELIMLGGGASGMGISPIDVEEMFRPDPDVVLPNTLPRTRKSKLLESDRGSGLGTSPLPRRDQLIRQLSHPAISSPYVSSIRPFAGRPISVTPPTDPFPPNPRMSPLPPFFQAMDKMADDPNSLEASIEVSHVLSQIASTERSRPEVNLESSLNIKMEDSFSLFICLALLVIGRETILSREMDFMTLSVHLNSLTGSYTLSHILRVARNLHKKYREFQSYYHRYSASPYETWLDKWEGRVGDAPPMATPSNVCRDFNNDNSATSCSINS